MDTKKVSAQGYLGKEVIGLKDGSFLGKVQSIAIDPENRIITGITIKLKGLLSGKMFIPFKGIQGFGTHSITIKESFEPQGDQRTPEEKEIMEMPVVTTSGTMLGKVSDFIFDSISGEIIEFILSGGLVRDTLKGTGVLKGKEVSRVGKDVIIVTNEIEELDLKSYVDLFNQEPNSDNLSHLGFKDSLEGEPEDTWQEALSHAKEVTESWKETLKEQGTRMSEEAKELKNTGQNKLEGFFSEAQKKAQGQLEKLNEVKDYWQDKLSTIKAKPQEELGEQVLAEIKGKTINAPLADDDGNVLILSGQIINDTLIRRTMEKGKIHDLFILTAAKDLEDELEKVDKP